MNFTFQVCVADALFVSFGVWLEEVHAGLGHILALYHLLIRFHDTIFTNILGVCVFLKR